MTARGRAALALGAATYLAGWAFGSRPLDLVAVGLLLAVLVAWLSVRLTARPVELRRSTRIVPLEGDDVQVRVELELESALAPAGITLVERYAKLGERHTQLQREGRHLWARYALPAVPRGRYRLEKAVALVEDPFGLERRERPLGEGTALVVYPRLKELEDSPREDVAVVLDAWQGCSRAVFDLAVRAAGSILQTYARRSRRAALVLGGAGIVIQRVQAEGDWRRALELLAGAEADAVDTPERLLAGDRNP